jgi:hypothetical protein
VTAPAALQHAPFDHSDEVLHLVAAFENRTLPKVQWTHRAHLTVALWYASHLSHDEALAAMRAGIQRVNHAHGVVTTATGGYHETITRFYMRVVGHFVRENGSQGDWAERANRLLERYGARDLPLRHYTKDRLMSPAARASWMEPDLLPLP